MKGIRVFALTGSLASNNAMAQERPLALTNARITPVKSGDRGWNDRGGNGKIEAVGPTSAKVSFICR